MRVATTSLALALALAFAAAAAVSTATAAPTATARSSTAELDAESKVLKGTWVRPDGGYTIVIANGAAGGQLEATYFNPRQLPFARAEASRQGSDLRVFLELRAGGYDGSTYDLRYDPASDRLTGVYYQAVAKQKYDIFFVRKN
ncbi:hypothetical protein [Candidatus Accumulibacter sp. ACC007]|uniref:hypothetical protein n=1 Tax=Candidatus Accumulibacter sp. ACC007 TaxID=2823333 RepID=UPI0025C4C2B4|nr:hypothetical protein [Candidatus Accumulibacter sp. ACC007]